MHLYLMYSSEDMEFSFILHWCHVVNFAFTPISSKFKIYYMTRWFLVRGGGASIWKKNLIHTPKRFSYRAFIFIMKKIIRGTYVRCLCTEGVWLYHSFDRKGKISISYMYDTFFFIWQFFSVVRTKTFRQVLFLK